MKRAEFKLHLERLLLEEYSKDGMEHVAKEIGGDADRFEVAWEIFCNGEPPLPQRMAWAMSMLMDEHPSLAIKYGATIAARIPYMSHPAELRMALRTLANNQVPLTAVGDLLQHLFPLLEDPQTPIAIRVHAMQILYNISNIEPDFKRELLLVIEAHTDTGGPGFANRAGKLIPKLRREIRAMEADAGAAS
ncbi:MAG: hypothetical protein U0176_19015 [Bacteroidia bacterium]